MKIDDALVDRLARLAKLDFDAATKSQIAKDLEQMATFFEKIEELDTDDIEPMIHVNEESYNVFRKDEVRVLVDRAAGLSNAPLRDEKYIKVPKMITK